MRKMILFFCMTVLTLTCFINKANATDTPLKVGAYIPIYYGWMSPDAKFTYNDKTYSVPFEKIDVLYIAFAHVYSADPKDPDNIKWSHLVTSIDNPPKDAYVLGYENRRGNWKDPSPPTPGNFDSDRIKKIVEFAKNKNPNIKILISLGWYTGGTDWVGIQKDYESGANMFPDSVVKYIQVSGLDGFDIDYESIPEGINFYEICQNIRTALDNAKPKPASPYIFTVTPAFNCTNYFDSKLVELFDYINPQQYFSSDTIITFKNLNVSPDKLNYGIALDGGPDHTEQLSNANGSYQSGATKGSFLWNLQEDSQPGVSGQDQPFYFIDHIYNDIHNPIIKN